MYTFDDYRNGMPPRAYGSETEYTHNGNLFYLVCGKFTPDNKILLPRPLKDFTDPAIAVTHGRRRDGGTTSSSVILTTGGEMYIDVGLLEYATPECQTPQELVLHERAGEQIVNDTFQKLARAAGLPSVEVYKRSGYTKVEVLNRLLMIETSCGNHENYTSINEFGLCDWRDRVALLSNSKNARLFADFLALRKLIDGVGMVDIGGYSISQKPRATDFQDFEHVMGHGVKKPFFQNSSRLEVRSGEGNKSDWAKQFIVELTSLVIRLIEHDAYPDDMMLANANDALNVLAYNPLGNVLLASGEQMKGIDVLKRIIDEAVELGESNTDFPKHEQRGAAKFYDFYDDLHDVNLMDNDVRALSDRIDWAARFEYLNFRGMEYSDLTATNLNAVRDDLRWDMIGEKDIARRRLHRLGHTALHVPIPQPPRTRAKARMNTIREIQQRDESIYSVLWQEITTGQGKYYFRGPLDSENMTFEPYKPIG